MMMKWCSPCEMTANDNILNDNDSIVDDIKQYYLL